MSKKAKDTEATTALAVPDLTERPAFLATAEKKGLAVINKVVTPPAVVIVQAMSDQLIEAGFTPGEVALMPAQEKLQDTLTVVPLFYYTVYQCLNPREMKDLRMIREETFDDESELAAKCRQLLDEPCPENDKLFIRYQQSLIVVCYVEELQTVVALRFYRSEYKTGKLFAAKIKARNASIFAGRYVLQVGVHKNDKGRWYAWDFKPTDRPWVSEEEYAQFEKMHDEIAEAHRTGTLKPVDVDTTEEDLEGAEY